MRSDSRKARDPAQVAQLREARVLRSAWLDARGARLVALEVRVFVIDSASEPCEGRVAQLRASAVVLASAS